MALWHLSALVLWSSSRRRGSSTPWHPVATPASVPSLEDIATPSRITGGRSISLTRSIRSWTARQACADVQSSQDPQPPLEGVSLWPQSLPWISCLTLRFDRGGWERGGRPETEVVTERRGCAGGTTQRWGATSSPVGGLIPVVVAAPPIEVRVWTVGLISHRQP
jgi:hypothetical protein